MHQFLLLPVNLGRSFFGMHHGDNFKTHQSNSGASGLFAANR